MRWSIPRLASPLGAGLGNEVIPWAKAYLGAKSLGIRVVQPPWRANPRRYDRELNAGPQGTLKYFALRSLPSTEVTTDMVIATGHSDYFDALASLAPGLRESRAPSILHTSGMHGGYLGIRRARPYLRREILGSPGALDVSERIAAFSDPCVRIGVHLRATDFARSAQVRPGVFNEQLPLEWYEGVVQSLSSRLSISSRVFLATDSPSDTMRNALTVDGQPPTSLATDSVGDLAMLSSCDIIVSSVSSFSMLAIFLSDAPYVWHRDQLGESNGWLSIWGHEVPSHGGDHTLNAKHHQASTKNRVRRGIAQGSDARWPEALLAQLEYRARSRQWQDDLIFYGVVEREGPA